MEGMREGRRKGKREGRREGISLMSTLYHTLSASGRLKDYERALDDAMYFEQLLKELKL